jgi:hypothetical protein
VDQGIRGQNAGSGATAPMETSPTVPRRPGPPPRAADAPPRPTGGNFGAAAALRARLLGKGPPQGSGIETGRQKEVVVLPSVDAQGRALPGAFGRDSAAEFGTAFPL